MCRVFLFFSRTCLCTQSSERCWLTANSNCPEAIGSHFQTGSFIFPWKGNGLWPRSLITPLVQHARSSGKPCDKHARPHACMQTNVETKLPEGRGWARERKGQKIWGERAGRVEKFLLSMQDRAVLRWNCSSDYGSELRFVLPIVVLSSKWKWGIRVDAVSSFAESCDRRKKLGEDESVCMCVSGVRTGWKWERLHFIEVHETLAPLNRTNFKPEAVLHNAQLSLKTRSLMSFFKVS